MCKVDSSIPFTVDIKMLAEGKERFSELYALSNEEREELRQTAGYRLALKDFWEIAAASSGISQTPKAFFALLGEAVHGVITEKVKIVG